MRINAGFVVSRSILLIYAILFLYGIACGFHYGYFQALFAADYADYIRAWQSAY